MNTGQKLVERSGLGSATAAQHLLAIRQAGATAGAMLVSASALPTGTAMQHLITYSSGGLASEWVVRMRRRRR